MVAISLSLAGCGATSALAVPTTPPLPQPAGCEAMSRSYPTLYALKWHGESDGAEEFEPEDPQAMEAELAAMLAAAREAKPGDPEMKGLVDDLEARISMIQIRLHAFADARAASRPDEAHAALLALLREVKANEGFLVASQRRCPAPTSVRSSSGYLPPEIIQTVIRARFSEFQRCYLAGLRRDPMLEGRVSVQFVITREGRVSEVVNADSVPERLVWRKWRAVPTPSAPSRPMSDPGVIDCVLLAFEDLTFPAPKVGIVTVTYPIMFAPGR